MYVCVRVLIRRDFAAFAGNGHEESGPFKEGCRKGNGQESRGGAVTDVANRDAG